MKLLLGSLLLALLCDLSSWSVSSTGTLVVTQTPHVSVIEGDPVNIDCCWTGMFERVGVHWLKNQTEIKNETITISTITSKGSGMQKETQTCSTLTFTNITREDSNTYICKVTVEIPLIIEAKGNGTVITVLDRANKTDNKEEDSSTVENSPPISSVLIYVLRCLPILSLVLTLLYFNYRLTKSHQEKTASPGGRQEDQSEGKKMRGRQKQSENEKEDLRICS
ncbi:uncharacterized protein LOC122973900 isoform X2 [Scomber scombrus]|uniref:Uncharacterized protein LOC122973900 isoform X2 n=1 Tax=Scomber scombrus TaxID=13677 RepID=A0AAV1P4H4_SCOSC